MKPKPHVSEEKKEEVKKIMELMKRYPCFGIIDLTSLPSATLQSIRHKIKKNDVLILTTKKSIIKIAIDNLKDDLKNIYDLIPILEQTMPALIFTTINPFKIASILNKNKTSAQAKPGQIAPKDIIIPAGPTKFTPGPIIGELGAVGIKTMIQEGKIAIKDDIDFVKKGDVIDKKKAEVLAKLGIEPMEIGINLVSLYEKGLIYQKDILSISEEDYINIIKMAYQNSFNLAVFINYMSKDTISTLVKMAYLQGKTLVSKMNIEFSEEIKTHKEEDTIKHDKGAVGYDESTVEKANAILKELQDQKMRENRT